MAPTRDANPNSVHSIVASWARGLPMLTEKPIRHAANTTAYFVERISFSSLGSDMVFFLPNVKGQAPGFAGLPAPSCSALVWFRIGSVSFQSPVDSSTSILDRC